MYFYCFFKIWRFLLYKIDGICKEFYTRITLLYLKLFKLCKFIHCIILFYGSSQEQSVPMFILHFIYFATFYVAALINVFRMTHFVMDTQIVQAARTKFIVSN